jgi:hypothetical protein
MHPVGSYCADESRCTINKTLNLNSKLNYLNSDGRERERERGMKRKGGGKYFIYVLFKGAVDYWGYR